LRGLRNRRCLEETLGREPIPAERTIRRISRWGYRYSKRGCMQPSSYVVPIVLAIAGAAVWAVALADVFQRAEWEFPARESGSNDRLLWMFVVVLFSGIGAVVYYFMVMKPYPRQRR